MITRIRADRAGRSGTGPVCRTARVSCPAGKSPTSVRRPRRPSRDTLSVTTGIRRHQSSSRLQQDESWLQPPVCSDESYLARQYAFFSAQRLTPGIAELRRCVREARTSRRLSRSHAGRLLRLLGLVETALLQFPRGCLRSELRTGTSSFPKSAIGAKRDQGIRRAS